jgi:hypothetical protein
MDADDCQMKKAAYDKKHGRLFPEYHANGDQTLTNASFGALQTGQDQSSGRSSNFVPSFASS